VAHDESPRQKLNKVSIWFLPEFMRLLFQVLRENFNNSAINEPEPRGTRWFQPKTRS
jgi:hypothetical protein